MGNTIIVKLWYTIFLFQINFYHIIHKIKMEISNLTAKITSNGQTILNGVNLKIKKGETHVIMGKNGSGKSTLSKVIAGHPDYEVTSGDLKFKSKNLLELGPEDRSHLGIFLSFQSPVEIPGVSNVDFLRLALNTRRRIQGKPDIDPVEFCSFLVPKLKELNMDLSFLSRNVNEGFSGGEKKKNEILQLVVLEADLVILDEIDSGLDMDALREVAQALNVLKKNNVSMLMITHYQQLLDLVKPDYIHIMQNGRIVKDGGWEIVDTLVKEGYDAVL